MNTTLQKGIDWVGYVDWPIRDFHSFTAQRGVTYNSYLIQDDDTALIDTVKAEFAHELLRNIAALRELSKIKYIRR